MAVRTRESTAASNGRTVHYAAERWAELVWAAAGAEEDPRTLAAWSRLVGVSVPTLRTRCYMAGVSPRSSLAMTRLVRALRLAHQDGAHPIDILDIREPRTVRKLLSKSGPLNAAPDAGALTINTFLDGQTLVTAALPVASLRRRACAPSEVVT